MVNGCNFWLSPDCCLEIVPGKLAFTGPHGLKFTYLVMPFGPVNGTATFIVFIHDMDTTWKAVAVTEGIVIDCKTNTRIIVDDIFSWAPTLRAALH